MANFSRCLPDHFVESGARDPEGPHPEGRFQGIGMNTRISTQQSLGLSPDSGQTRPSDISGTSGTFFGSTLPLPTSERPLVEEVASRNGHSGVAGVPGDVNGDDLVSCASHCPISAESLPSVGATLLDTTATTTDRNHNLDNHELINTVLDDGTLCPSLPRSSLSRPPRRGPLGSPSGTSWASPSASSPHVGLPIRIDDHCVDPHAAYGPAPTTGCNASQASVTGISASSSTRASSYEFGEDMWTHLDHVEIIDELLPKLSFGTLYSRPYDDFVHELAAPIGSDGRSSTAADPEHFDIGDDSDSSQEDYDEPYGIEVMYSEGFNLLTVATELSTTQDDGLYVDNALRDTIEHPHESSGSSSSTPCLSAPQLGLPCEELVLDWCCAGLPGQGIGTMNGHDTGCHCPAYGSPDLRHPHRELDRGRSREIPTPVTIEGSSGIREATVRHPPYHERADAPAPPLLSLPQLPLLARTPRNMKLIILILTMALAWPSALLTYWICAGTMLVILLIVALTLAWRLLHLVSCRILPPRATT